MVSAALRGYSMDLESSDPAQIRDYLAQQKAAENYELPAGLQKAAADRMRDRRLAGRKSGDAMFPHRAGPCRRERKPISGFL